MSGFRSFFGLLPPSTGSSPIHSVMPNVEPKTGIQVGVWFHDEKCWMYKGTYNLVLQFHRKTVEHCTEPYVVSKCAACEASRLKAQYGSRVKRWMVLLP